MRCCKDWGFGVVTYNPKCKKCGEHHLNFDPCPKPILMGEGVSKIHAPDGFHTMQGWGKQRRVPIVFQMPALATHGAVDG